jgi:hypothetical protein
MKAFKEFLAEAYKHTLGKPGIRVRVVRVRVRNGQIQRRKKVSAVKGYTLRGNALVRMSSMEKFHRKWGAKRAARKRRAKMSRIVMKRSRSLRRRRGLNLKVNRKQHLQWNA